MTNRHAGKYSDIEAVNQYFFWLCEKIHLVENDKPVEDFYTRFWVLLKHLHKKEYYGTVPNDDNRGSDGKRLRERFGDLTNYEPYDILDGPCTMLEMLVALAERCENMMADPDKGDQTAKWFWEFLENAGLMKYTDEVFIETGDISAINDVLERILAREYDEDGKGGFFPLDYPGKNQRKVEIWYQMGAYLMENYYLDIVE